MRIVLVLALTLLAAACGADEHPLTPTAPDALSGPVLDAGGTPSDDAGEAPFVPDAGCWCEDGAPQCSWVIELICPCPCDPACPVPERPNRACPGE